MPITPAQVEPWLLWMPLLPLLGAAVNGFFGRRLDKGLVGWIACGAVAVSLVIAALAFAGAQREDVVATAWRWFSVGRIHVDLAFRVDRLSAVMSLVVTGVSLLIHLYSLGYMHDDPGYARYFAYLNLFVAAMLTLVLADNLVVMFVGWEGVGLCSYLLIGFWFDDEAKASAGKKAFIVNRIGDFGFLLGIFTLIALFDTVSFPSIAQGVARVSAGDVIAAGRLFEGWTVGAVALMGALFLFLGACGKSAQIPLYVWLPDAMAGPTPVSALIHAATMVTAGVYMVGRLSAFYALAPAALATVALVGGLTALFAASIAIGQNDIKKVLAYSTVSQLGLMFVGAGVGAFFAALFHLVTHAFFKACLFLGSGSVIHGTGGEQDIRKMGGLKALMPHTHRTFLIATIAITGVLPLSGFFSKDEILHQALARQVPGFAWVGPTAYALGLGTALLTSFYMWRLYYLTFRGAYRGQAHVHESPAVMTWPLWILAILSIAAVIYAQPVADLLAGLFPAIQGVGLEAYLRRPFLPATLRLGEATHGAAWQTAVLYAVALAVAWAGFLAARALYATSEARDRVAEALPRLHRLLVHKWYVDEIYDAVFVRPLWAISRALYRVLDARLIDGLVVSGAAWMVSTAGALFRLLQNGDVQRYAAALALGAVAVLWVLL